MVILGIGKSNACFMSFYRTPLYEIMVHRLFPSFISFNQSETLLDFNQMRLETWQFHFEVLMVKTDIKNQDCGVTLICTSNTI